MERIVAPCSTALHAKQFCPHFHQQFTKHVFAGLARAAIAAISPVAVGGGVFYLLFVKQNRLSHIAKALQLLYG